MESLFNNMQHIIQNQQGMAFLAAFVAGLVSAASPCVLAAIPLIIGYVGGYSEGSRKKAAVYSLVFILGLAITFTLLGAAASLMGGLLGFLDRWLYAGLAVIAVLMGLQLMGILSIPLPFQKTRTVKSKGLWGAFLLGLLTGTVSSPCATPVVAVILAYVSTRGDILYGGSLLFAYAVGHCALIFLAGLSVGLTESIVSSQGVRNFSLYSKKLSGALLAAAGIYIGVVNF
ncbi:MAG: thiol:disulfide interchange protein [Nitrospirae bacterium GWD2_57_9]|nr:MAG: thiol:disulfide interchange protein [Nitrospirae bacterium GWD2_57_9]